MPKFDRDRFNNLPAKPVGMAAFTVIDRLQDFPKEVQIMGAAATFILLADHLKLDAQDVFTATKNLMVEKDSARPEFRGIKAYLSNVLK